MKQTMQSQQLGEQQEDDQKNEVNLEEHPDYDDRVRQLLIDLERQSKEHILELNKVQQEYHQYVVRSKEMEERCKTYQSDAERAIQSEREVRRELQRANQ